MWALLLDDLATTTAIVTRDLTLSKHSREDLLLDDFDTGTTTSRACVNVAVGCRTRTSAVITENAFLDLELGYARFESEIQ